MTTLKKQAEAYLKELAGRKRNPIKPATLSAYQSYINIWILPELGRMNLENVENGAMRDLVTKMAEKGLSASTIAGVTNCVKSIVSSANDKNGNELYPRKWNNDFIDAPIVDPKKQKNPVLGGPEVTGAIEHVSGQYRLLFALLAGSGLRISEALALKAVPDRRSSHWDRDRRVLVIKTALYRGTEQSTKTPAGVREIDLAVELNTFLSLTAPKEGLLFTNERQNGPVRLRTAYDVAEVVGVPGYHSFRRFRVTHLENVGVPRGLIQFWAGHEGKEVTDRYVKIGADIQARREWAEKAGLGFEIPCAK